MSATFASLLTPPGRSALATLALTGPCAWQVARQLFQPHSKQPLPLEPAPGKFWLGRMGADLRDEGILAIRQGSSYPLIELHVHGGKEVPRYLLELLEHHGVEITSWQRFLYGEQSDSIRAEAAIALTRAPTLRTAQILLDQYHGALHHEIAQGAYQPLLARASLGLHLTTPFRVVLAGAPNVGKSSLVNALAGYQRSIVSPSPGTTRDLVTTVIALDGWPVELVDTAGLRIGTESLEQAGIAQARLAIEAADLVLWILDATLPPIWPATTADNLHLIVNKIDQPAAWELSQVGEAPRVSARTGEGIAALGDRISHWLVPEVPPPGAGVPFTPEQVERLRLLATSSS